MDVFVLIHEDVLQDFQDSSRLQSISNESPEAVEEVARAKA
jgi:hypothetical protein